MKWIKKCDQSKWRKKIRTHLRKMIEDEYAISCWGWNNIIEHAVWDQFKEELGNEFPKNFYAIVREEMDEIYFGRKA